MEIHVPTGIKVINVPFESLPEFSPKDKGTIIYVRDTYYFGATSGWVSMERGRTGGSGIAGATGRSGSTGSSGISGTIGRKGSTGGGSYRDYTIHTEQNFNEYSVYHYTKTFEVTPTNNMFFVSVYDMWGRLIQPGYNDIDVLENGNLQFEVTGYLQGANVVTTEFNPNIWDGEILSSKQFHGNSWVITTFNYRYYSELYELEFICYDLFGREILPLNIDIDKANNILTFEFDKNYYGYLFIVNTSTQCNLFRPWKREQTTSHIHHQNNKSYEWTIIHNLRTKNLDIQVWDYGFDTTTLQKGDSTSLYEVSPYNGCTITPEVLGLGVHSTNEIYSRNKEYKIPQSDDTTSLVTFGPYEDCGTVGGTGPSVSQYSFDTEIIDENMIKLRMLRCFDHVFPTLWSNTGVAEITAKELPPDDYEYTEGKTFYGRMTAEQEQHRYSSWWSIHHGMDTTHILVDPRDELGEQITDCRFYLTYPHCNSVVVNFFKYDWEDIDPNEVDDDPDVSRLSGMNNIVPVRRKGKLIVTRVYPWWYLPAEDPYRTLLYTYYHNDLDETIWYIEHNLDLTSNEMVIECFNSDGHPIIPSSIFYISRNEIKLYFDEEVTIDNITTSHVTGYANIYDLGAKYDLSLKDNPYHMQSSPSYYWMFKHTQGNTNFAVQAYDDIANPISGYGIYHLTSDRTLVTFPTRNNPITGSIKIKEFNPLPELIDDWTRPTMLTNDKLVHKTKTGLNSDLNLDPEETYPTVTLGYQEVQPLSFVIISIHLSNCHGRPIQIFPDPEPEKPPAGYPEHFWMNLTGKYDFITGFSGGTGSKLEDSTGGTGSTGGIDLTALTVKLAFNPDQLYSIIDDSSTSPEAMLNPSVEGKALFLSTHSEGRLILCIKTIDNLPLNDGTFAYLKLYLKPEVNNLDAITIEQYPIGLNNQNDKIPIRYNSGLIKCITNCSPLDLSFSNNFNSVTNHQTTLSLTVDNNYCRSGYDNSLSISLSNLNYYNPSKIEFFIEYDSSLLLNINVVPSDRTLHKTTLLEFITDGLIKITIESPPDYSHITTIDDGKIVKLLFYIKRYNSIKSTKVTISNPLLTSGFIGLLIPKINCPDEIPIQLLTDEGYVHNEDKYGNFIGSTGYVGYLPDMDSTDFSSSDDEILFNQTTPTTLWHIRHNFNTYDIHFVFIRNQDGDPLEPEILMPTPDTLELHFEEPEQGSFVIRRYPSCEVPSLVTNYCEGMKIHVQDSYRYEWDIVHDLNTLDPFVVVTTDCSRRESDTTVPYILEVIDETRVKILFLRYENGITIPVLNTGRAYIMERKTVRLPTIVLDHCAIQQWDIIDKWEINHNLNSKKLSFRCVNYEGHPIAPSNIEFVDDDNVIITFSQIVLGEEVPFAVRGYVIIRVISDIQPSNDSNNMTYYHQPQFLWDWMNKESYGSPVYLPGMGAGHHDYYWRVRHNLNVRNPHVVFFDTDNKQIHPYRIYFINDQYFEAVFLDEFGQLTTVNGRVEVYSTCDEKFIPYLSPTAGTGGTGYYGGSGTTGGVGESKGGKGGTGSYWDYMLGYDNTFIRQPIVYFIVDYNQSNEDLLISDLDLPEGLIQTSETFINDYVTSCDFSEYGAIGFDRCEFTDDPDQYHFITLTTDKDYVLTNIENYDTTSLTYISMEACVCDAAQQINTDNYNGYSTETGRYVVLITSPRYLFNIDNITGCCIDNKTILHIISFGLTEGYSSTYRNYKSAAELTGGKLYMPQTSEELRDVLDNLSETIKIFYNLDNVMVDIPRTGETGGTGLTGGTGTQPVSDVFFQPKENKPSDKFNLGVSKLLLEVCYPNNQDRTVHFDEIYNSVLMLPHIFESGTGGTGGEYYTEDGDVVHLTHWEYPGDVYRRPFGYSWSQDGSTVKIHFDPETYKVLWAMPSVKLFDVAYYEPLHLQYNIDTTSYAPFFTDPNDQSSWQYDTTSLGFWMDHQTPGYDYGTVPGVVSQLPTKQVLINKIIQPVGMSIPAIVSDISYDDSEHPVHRLCSALWEWFEVKDFQSWILQVWKVWITHDYRTENVDQLRSDIVHIGMFDEMYSQFYNDPNVNNFGLFDYQLEELISYPDSNYSHVVVYITQKQYSILDSIAQKMLDTWNVTFHVILYDFDTVEYSSFVTQIGALNNVEVEVATSVEELISKYIAYLDSLVIHEYIFIEDDTAEVEYDHTPSEMWVEAHYHDVFNEDAIQQVEAQFIHTTAEFDKTAIYLVIVDDDSVVDRDTDGYVIPRAERLRTEVEMLLRRNPEFFENGGYFGVHRFNFTGDSVTEESITLPLSNNIEDISNALLNTESIKSTTWGDYNLFQEIVDNLNQDEFLGYRKHLICPSDLSTDYINNFLPIVKDNPFITFTHIFPHYFEYHVDLGNAFFYEYGNLSLFYVYETSYDNYYDYPLYNKSRSLYNSVKARDNVDQSLTDVNYFLTNLYYIKSSIDRDEIYSDLLFKYDIFDGNSFYYYSKYEHPYWNSDYMPPSGQYVSKKPPADSDGQFIGDDGDHRMLIALDTRENKNQPPGIKGDMSRHGIIYDGVKWIDYGVIIGPTSGFIEEEWSQQYNDEDLKCMPDINVYGSIEDDNTIVIQFTSGFNGHPINAWKLIRGGGEKIEISINYGYLEYDGLLDQLTERPLGEQYK